jgi:hypothetical protein
MPANDSPARASLRATRLLRARAFAALRGSRRLLAGLALLALLCVGCATSKSDIALAPLWTDISTAGGGREIEALAGAVRVRRREVDGPTREWALRPFVKETLEENGDRTARFLVPLGTRKVRKFQYLWQLLFLARYDYRLDEQGRARWSLLTIPLNYFADDGTDRTAWAVFPLAGSIEHFITFDRIDFLLFPLFLRTVREGQVSTSFLWPIFNWTYGPRGTSYRIFPLFGRLRQEGRYDRKFFLWPLFTWSTNFLSKEKPEHRWMFWPFYGHTERGDYHAESIAWPFFGWSGNPKTGMWAFDAPWPLVRFLRPGSDDPDGPRRSRVWPFYSHYKGDGLESQWLPWPIVNWREEVDMLGSRKSQYVVPLWQHWKRTETSGVESSWTKLWPVFQHYEHGAQTRFAFPSLLPFWHLPEIDDHYAWIYELVTRETDGERVSLRTWGNLYRREKDEREDRSYVSFLWSRRAYRAEGERRVEHSLLFGLLRWRHHPDGDGFWPTPLRPAFPGPGWPVRREPGSNP